MSEQQAKQFVIAMMRQEAISKAIGRTWYVTAEPVDLDDEEAYRRIDRVAKRFGDVKHLKQDIIDYLYKIGRVEPIEIRPGLVLQVKGEPGRNTTARCKSLDKPWPCCTWRVTVSKSRAPASRLVNHQLGLGQALSKGPPYGKRALAAPPGPLTIQRGIDRAAPGSGYHPVEQEELPRSPSV